MTAVHTQRIVVGVDASDESDVALREGLRTLATLPTAELHLVHAARPYVMPPMALGELAGYQTGRAHAEMLRTLPQQYWSKAVQLAEEEHVVPTADVIEVHVRIGSAPDVILEVAAEVGADLVIVGCHGRSGLRRAVLGSVAELVVRNAQCPVLVARGRTYPESATDVPESPLGEEATGREAPLDAVPAKFAHRTRRRVRWTHADTDAAGAT